MYLMYYLNDKGERVYTLQVRAILGVCRIEFNHTTLCRLILTHHRSLRAVAYYQYADTHEHVQ